MERQPIEFSVEVRRGADVGEVRNSLSDLGILILYGVESPTGRIVLYCRTVPPKFEEVFETTVVQSSHPPRDSILAPMHIPDGLKDRIDTIVMSGCVISNH